MGDINNEERIINGVLITGSINKDGRLLIMRGS